MNISLNWLKDYIDIDLSIEELSELLSNLGFPVEDVAELADDTVLDLEVTSNRGDCLSHIGVARELSAATGKPFKLPQVELLQSDTAVEDLVKIEIENPELCNRYTGRVIQGVKVGPTAEWMKSRLEAVGIRSVNNVVDATNYALMEIGQPPHAFDLATLKDSKIIVRQAKKGEKITSIDGNECELKPDMLVIADSEQPVGIAGVMGGLHTEISDSTTTVLLEDAHFSPLGIRTTARELSISSDASFRFERNVDIEMIDWASRRAAQLIIMVAGGKAAKGVVDIYPVKSKPAKVLMRLSRAEKLLGIKVATDEIIEIFSSLGLNPQLKGDSVECEIPTWRSGDLYREVDLIEEIIRVYGFDKIPTEKKITIEVAPVNKRQKFISQVIATLNSFGFYQAINITFTDKQTADLFSDVSAEKHFSVSDASRKNTNLLRQTLTGAMFSTLKNNYNAGNFDNKLFEIADTFTPVDGQAMPRENTMLTLVSDCDYRVCKGAVEGLIRNVNKNAEIKFTPCDVKWAVSAATITVCDVELGVIGILSSEVGGKIGLKKGVEAVGAELDFNVLMNVSADEIRIKPVAKYPAIVRDLSVIVDEYIAWADIDKSAKSSSCKYLEGIKFVDIYRGKPIAKGKKSVTLSLRFRDEDGTLTHEVVDSFESEIVKSLQTSVNAELRTV